MLDIKERLRLREISRFACATRSSSPALDDDLVEHLVAVRKSTLDINSPQLSPDPAMTAFAQLAALRLDCQYAFISLVDDSVQHVLAEATRTVSPFDKDIHLPGDEITIGARALECGMGICPITIKAFVGGPDEMVDSDVTFADSSQYVIYDLSLEPRTRSRPYVRQNSARKFFAEVPLRSSAGLVVGTVCVIDDKPRHRSSPVDIRALQDISLLVMRHLELVRLKEDHNRAERLMQGLAHFNQGHSSISKWVMDTPGQTLASDKENHMNQARQHEHVPLMYNEFPAVDRPRIMSETSATPSTQPAEYFSRPTSESATTVSVPTDLSDLSSRSESTPDFTTTSTETPQALDNTVTFDCPPQTPSVQVSSQSSISLNVRNAFSRAANLIRESMDLEAATFLEVSPDGRFNHRDGRHKTRSTKNMPMATGENNTSGDVSSTPGTTTSDSEASMNSHGDEADMSGSRDQVRCCGRLGFSTRFKSSVASSSITASSFTVPENLLNKLANRYPAGHIFTFDQYGVVSSGDDTQRSGDSSSSAKQRLPSRKKLANLLSACFPNARSLIFLPLYDNEKQHLYAGFIGWTTDPKRLLLKNELVYVAGFANSIMCEVMRLETLALDKAKSDFMSSMSHELRSPLHGILAATQLIQESKLSAAQGELATMIDTCGRTLLDIMNNLLDHAKINHFANRANLSNRKQIRESKISIQESSNLVSRVDLATILEETVVSVAAGHSVKEQRMNQISSRRTASPSRCNTEGNMTTRDTATVESPESSRPTVIVDIQRCDSWVFETEAGSWRRIIMNLVGNSLKYTQTGHVHVSLRVENGRSTKKSRSKASVVLTVSDTGQGISESYLKHRLFSPFAQENNLSVGAGLGLSIINQIVSSLKGRINIDSEIGVGTKVVVSVPCAAMPDHVQALGQASDGVSAPIWPPVSPGDTICFLGFDVLPALDSQPSGTLSYQASTMLKLKHSLAELATNWMNLKVVPDSSGATIIVLEESYANKLLKQHPRNEIFTKKYMIVSTDDHSGIDRRHWSGHADCVCAPIGPTKFARALAAVLSSKYSNLDSSSGQPSSTMQSISVQRKDSNAHSDPETAVTPYTSLPDPAKPLATEKPPSQRLMLVDDNDINLRILASLARKLSLKYITACNGREALDRYCASYDRGEPLDYIFMDISMPIMDGLTSTRLIRSFEREKRLARPSKIIALTGLASAQAQDEALASGVDLYLTKPVKLNAIREILSSE